MMGLVFLVNQANHPVFLFSSMLKLKNRTMNIALAEKVGTSHQATKINAEILTILMDKITSFIPTT